MSQQHSMAWRWLPVFDSRGRRAMEIQDSSSCSAAGESMALIRSACRSCHLPALVKPVTHPHAAHPVATRLLPKPIMWGSPVTETYCIMRLHSRQWHSACSPWTRSRAARQQGAEPERRIGAFLIAMALGRRRVTLVVRLLNRFALCSTEYSSCDSDIL